MIQRGIAHRLNNVILYEMGFASSTLKADATRLPTAVRLLFFGPIRVQLGIETCDVTCPEEMSVDELWSNLTERFEGLKSLRTTTRLARNGEFLEPDTLVRPGDEIALIPPVSGG